MAARLGNFDADGASREGQCPAESQEVTDISRPFPDLSPRSHLFRPDAASEAPLQAPDPNGPGGLRSSPAGCRPDTTELILTSKSPRVRNLQHYRERDQDDDHPLQQFHASIRRLVGHLLVDVVEGLQLAQNGGIPVVEVKPPVHEAIRARQVLVPEQL